MNAKLLVVDDVAKEFADLIESRSANQESFSIALSGGSSAEPCYREMASRPIDWSHISLFWSDERCVELESDMSNAGQAKRLFIDSLSPQPFYFPMNCHDGPDAYEFLIRTTGPFDVVHLGIGTDGHTASLFPESPALSVEDRFVTTNEDPIGRNPVPRMTLTYAGIANSKLIVFTVLGESKAEVLRDVMSGTDLPATHVYGPQVLVIADYAAASLTYV